MSTALQSEARAWRQYICRACGLIYDEAEGDPDSGLAPGTRFEDIPDDWSCPICGVTKADFDPYVPKTPAAAPAHVMSSSRKAGVVVVGAGTAGWSVAEAIRALDPAVPVTIVTRCEGDVYHKPELSVALSRGQTVERLRRSSGIDNAARLGARLMSMTTAIRIAKSEKRLRTTRGPIAYSHLVLAMGACPAASPALPPDLCWRINDLRSWTVLHRVLSKGRQEIAIVGAGLVGCELAEDFARGGHRVTLFGRAGEPLEELPPQAGARLRAGLERLGVTFAGSCAVQQVSRSADGRKRLTLVTGEAHVADIVISAIGLITGDRLAATAGLDFRAGLAVDARTLMTSVPNIYGIGDCISIDGRPCRFIEPIARQAEVIAHQVLGLSHAGYAHSAPVIRLKTKSAPLAISGAPRGHDGWRLVADDASRFEMEQWRDGALVARISA